MKHSVKFSDAIHIMSYIEMYQGTDLASDTIALSVTTNPVSVRKIMSQLKKSGLIISKNGKAEPKLARRPDTITLYDIYKSVAPEEKIFHVDETTEPACLVGGNIQSVLNQTYDTWQKKVEDDMKQTTLSMIIESIAQAEQQRNPERQGNEGRIAPYL